MSSKLTITSTLPLLHTTHSIPRLGFGVYDSPPDKCIQSCLTALKSGYRHIDTAQYYANEREVGHAIQKWVSEGHGKRSDVFLTTKILAAAGSVQKSYERCVESVEKIDPRPEGYVDLFLIHSPNAGKEKRKEMWLALEKLYAEGKARAVGVSNFGVGQIEEMKEYAKVWPPMVNQIELHPWCQQRRTVEYCQRAGIVVQAYSPLVRNMKAHDRTLVDVSKRYGVGTTQVLVRYCLQKGWVPLPKSDNEKRIASNADVYGFEITEEDMKMLDGQDQGERGAIVQAVRND